MIKVFFFPSDALGGYVSGSRVATLMRQAIVQLCADLKDDAVSLVDVVAPPDHVLNSALGVADGRVITLPCSVFLFLSIVI